MTMRAFLNAARDRDIAAPAAPFKPRHPVTRRRLAIESLEDRRVLAASSFINALYQDVLNRAPDSAGLAYFTNLLADGVQPSAIVADIWNSAEHRTIEVDSFYQAFLNRAPDAAGLQFWVSSMLNGMTEETVMADILGSAEFQHDSWEELERKEKMKRRIFS